jgi:hypothetical protein
MAIGFTAELSHYPSGGRYATRATIPAPPTQGSPAILAGPAITPNPCKGVVCPPGKKCIVGVARDNNPPPWGCVDATISCPSGESECAGTNGPPYCAPLMSDSNNCGTCGNWCNFDQSCREGNCECTDTKLTYCGYGVSGIYYGCTDLTSDPANCGGCGVQCSSGICINGVCCPVEQVCNGVCCPVGEQCAGCDPGEICANGLCCPPVENPTSCGSGGRYSNSNYFFANSCQPITGLTVSFTATDDIVSSDAFSMQLNAYSQQGVDAAQQYLFKVVGKSIQGWINNWQANKTTAIVCGGIGMGGTTAENTLPAGCTLQIALEYTGNVVSGAVFTTLCNDKTVESHALSVSDAGCHCGLPAGYSCVGYQSPADLSAITAFQVNIVGAGGGSSATFTKGSGNIVYAVSDGTLTPLRSLPGCIDTFFCTEETSNATYGVLNSCPAPSLTQTFSHTDF